MKKKGLFGIAFVALATVGLVACQNDGGEGGGGVSDKGFIKEKTKIYFWSTIGDNNQGQINNYIKSFKEVEPNVTVENVKQSGSYNDLENMVITGFNGQNYPDLVQAYPDHVADYINYGKAVKLDPYMDNPQYGWTAEEKADIVQAYLTEGQEYTVSGTYSLPFSKSTEAMFYNEDLLIGLDLSPVDATINNGNPLNHDYLNNLTWEEFFTKLAPAIMTYDQRHDDGVDPEVYKNDLLKDVDGVSAVMGYDSDDNLFITLCRQYGFPYTSVAGGKGVIEFNNDGIKDLLTSWKEYVNKGYFITKGINEGNYVNELFTARGCLFSIGSTGGVKYQFNEEAPMNVGVANIPQAAGEGKTKAVINQGPSLAILDHGDENRKLASWLFYKHITNKENSLDWALNSGYNAIRTSNYEDPAYLETNDITNTDPQTLDRVMVKTNLYTGQVTDWLFVSPAFRGSSTAREQAGGLVTNVLLPSTDASKVDGLFAEAENIAKLAL